MNLLHLLFAIGLLAQLGGTGPLGYDDGTSPSIYEDKNGDLVLTRCDVTVQEDVRIPAQGQPQHGRPSDQSWASRVRHHPHEDPVGPRRIQSTQRERSNGGHVGVMGAVQSTRQCSQDPLRAMISFQRIAGHRHRAQPSQGPQGRHFAAGTEMFAGIDKNLGGVFIAQPAKRHDRGNRRHLAPGG